MANLALLLMPIIWAVNFPIAKVAIGRVSPLAFNALRFPLASLALLLVLRARHTALLPRREDWLRIILLGLGGNALYQQFFIFGLVYSKAGIASLLLAGTPLLTAILSASLGHERVRPRVWAGAFCTLTGIALVVAFSEQQTTGRENTPVGAALLFSASLAWAVYTVGSRSLIKRYGALPVTAWTIWSGTIAIALIGAPSVAATDLEALTLSTWLAIVYAGVASLGIAYVIWYHGVEVLGNTRTSVYSNLVPALTLAVAWLWLREVPSPGQLAGAAIIIGGVTLAQAGR